MNQISALSGNALAAKWDRRHRAKQKAFGKEVGCITGDVSPLAYYAKYDPKSAAKQLLRLIEEGRNENEHPNGYLGGLMSQDALEVLLQVIDSKWCARQDSNLRPSDS